MPKAEFRPSLAHWRRLGTRDRSGPGGRNGRGAHQGAEPDRRGFAGDSRRASPTNRSVRAGRSRSSRIVVGRKKAPKASVLRTGRRRADRRSRALLWLDEDAEFHGRLLASDDGDRSAKGTFPRDPRRGSDSQCQQGTVAAAAHDDRDRWRHRAGVFVGSGVVIKDNGHGSRLNVRDVRAAERAGVRMMADGERPPVDGSLDGDADRPWRAGQVFGSTGCIRYFWVIVGASKA